MKRFVFIRLTKQINLKNNKQANFFGRDLIGLLENEDNIYAKTGNIWLFSCKIWTPEHPIIEQNQSENITKKKTLTTGLI